MSSSELLRGRAGRRPRRRTLLVLALPAALAACGFHLREPQTMNYQRIALSGFPDRSYMAQEIRRAMPEGTQVVPSVLDAQVVIESLIDKRELLVEAQTAFGQVRELELHVRLRYRVLAPDGTELLPASDIERYRDLTYDETDALAKDSEQNTLFRAMQSDMAIQLVRVLAALSKQGGVAAHVGAAHAASAALAGMASAPASR